MEDDIDLCKRCNVSEVVFGILTPQSKIDIEKTKKLAFKAYPLPITFHKAIDQTKDMFLEFLNENGKELRSEFLIPSVINDLIQSEREQVHVLRSNSSWFGVTYKEDKPYVMVEIEKLINAGAYPLKLFE